MNDTTDSQRRYTDCPFPAYRFRPGQNPHPTRDPQGHSHAAPAPQVAQFDAEHWHACQEFLYGVDLFNHGYWWEAHEAWEAVWIAADRYTPIGFFVQGLIQAAASLLKHSLGQEKGAQSLWMAGSEKLRCPGERCLGIDVRKLRTDMDEHLNGRQPRPPLIELEFPER